MTSTDFMKFNAIVQAANGQAIPFYFNLNNKDGLPILWKKFHSNSVTVTQPRLVNSIVVGDTTMLVEGFNSNENNAFLEGEVFIDGNNENGSLHTALSGTNANIYGEAKIRTPWPFREAQGAGQKVYKEPAHAVVTLNSDEFSYRVDTAGYYYMSIAFDLDGWK